MVFDAMAAGKDGWVGGQHAVDVGPDLNFLGADARADDGCGEVGTAAPERGGDAFFGGRDEASHDDDLVLCQGRQNFGEALVGFGEKRRGLGMAMIGDDDAAGIDMHRG